jgi:hypothetical protein
VNRQKPDVDVLFCSNADGTGRGALAFMAFDVRARAPAHGQARYVRSATASTFIPTTHRPNFLALQLSVTARLVRPGIGRQQARQRPT